MKEGASDPFADAESEPESDPASDSEPRDPDAAGSAADASDSAAPSTSSGLEDSDWDEGREQASTADGEPANGSGARGDATAGRPDNGGVSVSPEDLPYVLARDNVKDQRPSVHQLFVQDETDRAAKDAERELEEILDEDVYRLDAREAIYLAGIRNLDDAAAVLRRWGYDL